MAEPIEPPDDLDDIEGWVDATAHLSREEYVEATVRRFSPVALICYADVPVHSDAWHEIRRAGLGSSDAADIAGLGYGSPFAKWAEKTADSWPAVDNAATRWGTRLEAVVADHFAEAHPEFQVCEPAFMYAHPERPWMRASPDRLLYSGDILWGLLEIKTSRMQDLWEDGPPDFVVVQVQHQLAVMDLPEAWIAVLLHGRDYREYRIERDEELIGYLYAIEERFWRRVQDGDPPPVDGSDATTEALKALYAAAPDEEVELPESARALLMDVQRARVLVKDVEAEQTRLENTVKQMLGTATVGLLDGRPAVTWKAYERQSIDVKALRAAHPAVAEEFTTVAEYRKLAFPKE